MVSPRPGGPLPRDEHGRLLHRHRHMVRNCRGIYLPGDVAAYFGVDLKSVKAIYAWEPDCDCVVSTVPNIFGTQVTHDLILADAQILANRNYTLTEIAAHFGVTDTMVRSAFDKAGRTLRLNPHFEHKMHAGNEYTLSHRPMRPERELVMFG